MITRKIINEKMSRIVEHNGTIYFAGIVSDDKELDIKVQAKRALEIAEERFKEAGTDKHHLLREIENNFTWGKYAERIVNAMKRVG